ncbi:MAG: lamin tail domain-containing protein [Raineya sp.]|nr:lamin tail domain-containing protein [Raineya sp.]
MKKQLIIGFLFWLSYFSQAQVIRFSFTGATGTPATFPADAQPANGSVTDFARSASITPITSTDNFGASGWNVASLDLNRYFSFTITANAGFVLNLSSFELDEIRSGTGPTQWVLRSSRDGFTTDLGTYTNTGTTLITNRVIALNENFYNVSGSIEFRIYAFGASSAAGTWRVDNVELFGNISTPDVTPPTLVSASTLVNNQLDVFFSESVTLASAQNVANYSVSGGIGTPTTATRNPTNFSQVTLTFATPFVNNQTYTVTATNIVDFASNTQPSTQTSFTYLQISTASQRDIIINEIMADETPVVGLPASEYVELYNRSNKNINLKNWTLNTRTITTNDFILQPNQYVLLCPQANASLFSGFGTVIGMPSWDALTNSGETITLRDVPNNTDIDVVTYALSWYRNTTKDDGGWSLELINPTLPCSDENNWIASNSPLGGTPAQQNSVFNNTPDTQAPRISNTAIPAPNIVRIVFNEPMNQSSLLSASYNFSGGISVSSVTVVSDKEVQLNLSSNLVAGDIYTLTLNGLQDCVGNALQANTQLQLGLGLTPTFHQVIITEIFADPDPRVALPEQEYLELYNRTNKVISLQGCKLSDNTSSVTLPAINILPNQYILLVNASVVNDFSAYSNVYGISGMVSLNNSGERLTLTAPNGSQIFTVAYSDSWYKDVTKKQGGWSLEMIDTNNPCGEAENWTASVNSNGGTPATENSVKEARPDNMPPRLLRADAINNNTVILNFNERLDSTVAANASYNVDKGISVQSRAVLAPDFKKVRLTLSPNLQVREKYRVVVQSLTDCSGNLIGEANFADFGVPEQADSLDILLNEVLFNPRAGGNDFVELYNNSDKYINLKGWSLARIRNNAIDSKKSITDEDYVLPPRSYVAISDDILNIQQNYPLSEGKPMLQTPSSLPAFTAERDVVLVINNLDKIVERFDYDEKMHFKLLDDVKGVSLERLGFDLPTNDANSWFSAASSVGFATPGYENSQNKLYQNQSGEITIVPKVFTPNNDGQADFTSINFKFAGQGNVANVTIYDTQGRIVRYLVRNQTLPNEGSLLWDGTNEEKNRVLPGYYVVLFEIFNLSGKKETYKETVAVVGKF